MEFSYFVYNEKDEIKKESKNVSVTKGSNWSWEERNKRWGINGRRRRVVGRNSGKYGDEDEEKREEEEEKGRSKKERKSGLK